MARRRTTYNIAPQHCAGLHTVSTFLQQASPTASSAVAERTVAAATRPPTARGEEALDLKSIALYPSRVRFPTEAVRRLCPYASSTTVAGLM